MERGGWREWEVTVEDEGDFGGVDDGFGGLPVTFAFVHLAGGTGVEGEKAERIAVDDIHEREQLVRPVDAEAGFDGEAIRSHHFTADIEHPAEDIRRAEESRAASLVADHRERTSAVEIGGRETGGLDPL